MSCIMRSFYYVLILFMAGVAQLVRAPDCDSGGRRFNSGHSPHLYFPDMEFDGGYMRVYICTCSSAG